MDVISSQMRRAIRKYEEIKVDGLTLYPIKVAEYETFLAVRPAIEFMQQSLPMRYMSLPLLSAFYRIDYEAITQGKRAEGMFLRSLVALALSLRLGEGEEPENRAKHFRIFCDPKEPSRFKKLQFIMDGEEKEVTAVQFQRLRPIIATQNGVEIYPDDVNPDLVQAERDIIEKNAPKMDVRIDDLISAVAALSGAEEAEIEDWPILKLQNRQRAFKRTMDYMICSIGESQGTKWKGGNPHPSPWFDRAKEGSAGLMPMEEFANGEGLKAIQNAGGVESADNQN